VTSLQSRDRIERDMMEAYVDFRFQKGAPNPTMSVPTPYYRGTYLKHLMIEQLLTRESIEDIVAMCLDAAEDVDGVVRHTSPSGAKVKLWTTMRIFTVLSRKSGDGRSPTGEFQSRRSGTDFMTADVGESAVALPRYERTVRRLLRSLMKWPTIILTVDVYGKDTRPRRHRSGRP
jgi:hypothetical protein